MNLRRIKHTLLRMSAEEKVISIGSILILVSTFMPWYEIVHSYKENKIFTGLSGDLGIIGFVILLMSLFSLLIIMAENLHLPFANFGYKKEHILLFLSGESFIFSLLATAIHTKNSFGYSDANLRFGIYLVLIASLFGALSAFSMIQKNRKEEVEDFFNHEEDHQKNEKINNKVQEKEKPIYFEEDSRLIESIEEQAEEQSSNYIQEDDGLENMRVKEGQANYFTREAGIHSKD